jgi:hypothetical protein
MAKTCPVCDFTYVPELSGDRGQHRHFHDQITRCLEPIPTKRFSDAILKVGEYVDIRSAKWKHKEMYARARMFKREFSYDFIAWDVTGREFGQRGYLFNDDTKTFGDGCIAGACGIHWVEYSNAPARWQLTWVWIAPRDRRKGILSRRWSGILSVFPNLYPSRPLSPGMESFLAKHLDAS